MSECSLSTKTALPGQILGGLPEAKTELQDPRQVVGKKQASAVGTGQL